MEFEKPSSGIKPTALGWVTSAFSKEKDNSIAP